MPVSPSAYRIGSPTLAASSSGRVSPALRGVLNGAGINPNGSVAPPTDIHNTTPPKTGLAAAAAPDPFAQLTPAQIQQQIGQYTAGMPKPLTDQQITSRAQGEINPILAKITAAINARAANAGKAISGYTNDLAAKLGQVDYGAPYAGAEQQQAGVDAALSQALAGGGLSDAQGLQSRLAQIGEPGVVGDAANAVQGNATGNSNAVLAGGSADLGALIAEKAAAGAFGLKQPGIARLAGLQDLAGANQTAQTQIGDQTAQVETQLPGILNDLRSQSDTRAGNISSLAADLYKTLTGQNITKATAQAGLATDTSKLLAPQTFGSGSSGYYQYDPSTGQVAQLTAPAPKTVTPKSVSPGSTLIDPATGKVIYKAPPKATKTPAAAVLSPSQAKGLATQIRAWHTGQTGTAAGAPVTDPSAKLTYTEALSRAVAQAPSSPAGQAKATQLVNAEYGTPASIAVKAVAAAKKSGYGLTDAVHALLQAQADGSADLPITQYLPALSKVYGQPPEAVKAVLSQLMQLVQSGQLGG
jgi:hypothetical protein